MSLLPLLPPLLSYMLSTLCDAGDVNVNVHADVDSGDCGVLPSLRCTSPRSISWSDDWTNLTDDFLGLIFLERVWGSTIDFCACCHSWGRLAMTDSDMPAKLFSA